MSDEQDIKLDPSLRQAYSDLSNETTPDALDASILDAARPSARLSNLLALKPLSWAAITLLSIGLALELQRSTPETPDGLSTEPAAAETVDEVLRSLEQHSADGPAEKAEGDSAPLGFTAEPTIAEPRTRSLQTIREEAAVSETLDRGQAAPAAQLFEDRDDLQFAPETERFCDEVEIVDANSWYRCVLRLREEGLDEEAAFELSLLRSRFPDFETR